MARIVSKEMKNGSILKSCFGILKKDTEWINAKKNIKKGWANWKKR